MWIRIYIFALSLTHPLSLSLSHALRIKTFTTHIYTKLAKRHVSF